jgi:hypothetical protein
VLLRDCARIALFYTLACFSSLTQILAEMLAQIIYTTLLHQPLTDNLTLQKSQKVYRTESI